jgi:hypothetical protein
VCVYTRLYNEDNGGLQLEKYMDHLPHRQVFCHLLRDADDVTFHTSFILRVNYTYN